YLIDLARALRWTTVSKHLRELPKWFTDAERGVFAREFFHDLVTCHLPDTLLPLARRVRAAFRRGTPPGSYYSDTLKARAQRRWRPRGAPRARSASVYAASQYRGLRSTT